MEIRMERLKYVKLILSVFLLCGVCVTTSQAQSQTVKGKVTDKASGSSLPGVNILVKGSTNGTATDPKGNFTLDVSSLQDTLVFSYIGYQSQIVPINGRTTINVMLASRTISGKELVVVGYGSQEKKTITSSVTSVSSSDFNKGTINNPAQLLQGKVSGLTITKPGGDPNGNYQIRLRGLSSIGANSSPLVVIDGVPGASLSSVDPNDIKSIDVLKDASSSAIYGTRGSGGVIIITTKTGSNTSGKAKFNVEYNGSVAMSNPYREIKVLNASQYKSLSGVTDLGSSTNWLGAITQTGYDQIHELAFTGGAKNTNYRASLNYRDVQGIERQTGFNQLNGRLNLTQYALNQKATFKVNLSVTNKNQKLGFPEAFRYAAIYNPTASIMDPQNTTNGGYSESNLFDYFNPVAIINQNINQGDHKQLLGSLRAEYDFSDYVPGLSAAGFYSEQRRSTSNDQYYPSTAYYRGSNRNGLARESSDNFTDRLAEGTVHYLHTIFKNMDLDAVAGYSYQSFVHTNNFIDTGDFITNAFTFNNLGASQDLSNGLATVTSEKDSHKLIAFFGRANFNYHDTYFLSASIRHEGSSRFGANNKWGNFWAVNGGIQLTQLVSIPNVNSLKIRGSYGVTGNDAPSSYLSLLRFSPNGSFLVNGNYIPAYGPSQQDNPDLQWETKKGLDFGVDFALLNSRISGSVDYYSDKTDNLIYQASVPVPPNLSSTEWINVGQLNNAGLDINVNFQAIQQRDISWTTGLTYTHYKRTELASLSNSKFQFGDQQYVSNLGAPGQNNTYLIRVKEGQPIGQIWGPIYAGVQNGHWMVKQLDKNGNPTGKIIPFSQATPQDRTVIGNGLPKWQFGWNNSFHYKNWDLNMFIRGTFGHDLVNTYRAFYQDPSPSVVGQHNVLASSLALKGLTDNPQFTSFDVEKGDFVKLDNMTLGYTVPMPSNFSVSSLRIYVTGQNLFTITNYKGPDPEPQLSDVGSQDNGGFAPNANNPDKLAPGIDRRNSWFMARTFTVGVNLKF
jgi:TonB-linked SusC/RagA family outer membrane protein